MYYFFFGLTSFFVFYEILRLLLQSIEQMIGNDKTIRPMFFLILLFSMIFFVAINIISWIGAPGYAPDAQRILASLERLANSQFLAGIAAGFVVRQGLLIAATMKLEGNPASLLKEGGFIAIILGLVILLPLLSIINWSALEKFSGAGISFEINTSGVNASPAPQELSAARSPTVAGQMEAGSFRPRTISTLFDLVGFSRGEVDIAWENPYSGDHLRRFDPSDASTEYNVRNPIRNHIFDRDSNFSRIVDPTARSYQTNYRNHESLLHFFRPFVSCILAYIHATDDDRLIAIQATPAALQLSRVIRTVGPASEPDPKVLGATRLGVIHRADQRFCGGIGCGRTNTGKGIGKRAAASPAT